ncbi:MAG: hypothetical protein D6707_09350 [Bacteroidetes bacterium]|nr:MAG: hypothetical protein D6707_09350 [Bacteroidota bacterium]
MKKYTVLLLLVLTYSLSFSQYNWDFGIGIGAANYLGDIGGKEKPARPFVWDIKLSQTRWDITGGFARYRFHDNFAAHVGLNIAEIRGADSLSTNPERVGRNLDFRNRIIELAGRIEWYFYSIADVGGTGMYQLDFRSYVFAGVGGIYHNPMGYLNGWVPLRPLKTEGQDKEYSKFALSIPVGVGLFYTYKRNHRFGWEFGWRWTNTDYLDDISGTYPDPSELESDLARQMSNKNKPGLPTDIPSQNYGTKGSPRGDPTDRDSYFITSFTYSYVMRGKGKFYRKRYGYVYGGKRRSRRTRAKF